MGIQSVQEQLQGIITPNSGKDVEINPTLHCLFYPGDGLH